METADLKQTDAVRSGGTPEAPGVLAAVQLPGETCPTPAPIAVAACQDAVRRELPPVGLSSLGRVIQLDVVLKSICPGKRVAATVILMEVAPDGTRLPRGVKHILVPAQTGEACQDLTLRCIQFSLPEALDAGGQTDSICNARNFEAQVIANYVDTDYVCCDPLIQTV